MLTKKIIRSSIICCFIIVLLSLLTSAQGEITHICNGYVCMDYHKTLIPDIKPIPVLYVWVSDTHDSVYDDDVAGFKDTLILENGSYSTSFCIIHPQTDDKHYLFTRSYYNGIYESDVIEFSNKEYDCDNFSIKNNIESELFKKILHYPIIKIPYDDNINIFDNVKGNNVSVYEITFAMSLYFIGIMLLLVYFIMLIGNKI